MAPVSALIPLDIVQALSSLLSSLALAGWPIQGYAQGAGSQSAQSSGTPPSGADELLPPKTARVPRESEAEHATIQ